jgi:hypothetical protein
MPSPAPKKTSTNQFMRMGHTASAYGNDPSLSPLGEPGEPPREIKP